MTEGKADVNQAATLDGFTPLAIAFENGHFQIAQWLVENTLADTTKLLQSKTLFEKTTISAWENTRLQKLIYDHTPLELDVCKIMSSFLKK